MIYEFKTYRATEGASERLKKRFAEKTMPIFARLGIEVVHCWTSDDEPDAFFYMVRFASEEARKAAWAAFAADAEWKGAKAASETNGPLLASQTTVLLKETDFSPAHGGRK
jgi:heme-degrading monooxygenase HmoA